MDKESFIFHSKWMDAIAELPDNIRLEIYETIIRYSTTGELTELSPMAKLAFNFIKGHIDKDAEKYDDICTKRKNAVQNRWKKNNEETPSAKADTNVCKDDTNVFSSNTKNTNVFPSNTKNTNAFPSNTKNTNAFLNDTNAYKTIQNDTDAYKPIQTGSDIDIDIDIDTDSMSSTSIASEEHSNLSSSLHSEDLSFPAVAETDEPEKRFHKNFMDFFNQEIKTAGAVIKSIQIMTDKRKGLINARLRECGKQKLAIAIQKAARSDFLNGRGERYFVASFDWIMKPNNFPKVLEGNYDNDRFKNTGYDNTTVRQSSAAMEKAERDKRLEADANIMRTWLES